MTELLLLLLLLLQLQELLKLQQMRVVPNGAAQNWHG
jgi:hypothetical protein